VKRKQGVVVNLNGVLGFVSAVDLRFTLERKEFEEVDTPALNAGLGSVFAVKADTAALVADNCVCVLCLCVALVCACFRVGRGTNSHLTILHRQITGYQPYVKYVLVPVVLGLLSFGPKFGISLSCLVATPTNELEGITDIKQIEVDCWL
jgi:hypothetical protein